MFSVSKGDLASSTGLTHVMGGGGGGGNMQASWLVFLKVILLLPQVQLM